MSIGPATRLDEQALGPRRMRLRKSASKHAHSQNGERSQNELMDITSPEYAAELDRQDELAEFRDRFVVEDPELIYVDGNSLGRMPKATLDRLAKTAQQEWGGGLVRCWSDWFQIPTQLGGKIANII